MKLQRLSLRKPLPVRQGLSPSAVWLPEGPWELVIDFLCHHFKEIQRDSWAQRMKSSEVVSEDGDVFTPQSPFRPNTHLFYYRQLEDEAPIPFREEILYQDENIIVADKPHFLPTVPAGRFLFQTLLVRLQESLGSETLVPMHRLDRETAGVVAFCKTPANRGAYQTLFARGEVGKRYQAIAPPLKDLEFPLLHRSRIETGEPFFRMREVEGKANSETKIEVIAKAKDHWLYSLQPKTGKKHQLRLHLNSLGAGILNDPLYPHLQDDKGTDYSRPLQLLAKSLSFTDPLSGVKHCFTSRRELDFNPWEGL